MTTPSPAYLKCLAEAARHHASNKTYAGKLLRHHAHWIKGIVEITGSKTVLDYGCGKGLQYEWVGPEIGNQDLARYWGVDITKYDPAWPPFAREPIGKFDLVICTNVLGGIPAEDLSWVVDRIYGLAGKAIYFAEKVGNDPKKKVVSDATALPNFRTVGQWVLAVRRPDSPLMAVFAGKDEESGIWGRYWL